jgi:hypothetical protein
VAALGKTILTIIALAFFAAILAAVLTTPLGDTPPHLARELADSEAANTDTGTDHAH